MLRVKDEAERVPPDVCDESAAVEAAVAAGDRLRKEGHAAAALETYVSAARRVETPPAQLCLGLARCSLELGDLAGARHWLAALTDATDDFAAWHAAAGLLRQTGAVAPGPGVRTARLAVLGSYTTGQLTSLLSLAALQRGIVLDLYESDYGQYRQEILDPASKMYRHAPDFVLLAVHEAEVALPEYSGAPRDEVAAEAQRWTALWRAVAERSSARVIQHNFVVPSEPALGHLAARTAGTRYRMLQALNQALGDEAGNTVSIVDCDRLAASIGKQRWFDPRYWYHSKQAVALGALPLLARHTAAVIAADLGLSRKCLVLDLDNTLWGGVVGEDGLAGIRLGSGAEGEAYTGFQEHLLRLKEKGIILAVCSKNNEADAREVFERHPGMKLRLDDIACFVANWESKAANLRTIAARLNIGLDALVLVDDNPVERQAIRQLVPEVDVVLLPENASGYSRALSQYLGLETSSFTAEDRMRTAQYQARARLAELESAAESLEDFYRSLRMEAVVEPFNDLDLPRIAQLLGKTNQFNLTTRRHTIARLQEFMADPGCVHFSFRLKDIFTDHGLVGVLIARREGEVLDIDTWLMSCRVIGRTVEAEMLQHLCRRALELGCSVLRGSYIPTAKNALVKDVFARFGFQLLADDNGATSWRYDLAAQGAITNGFISVKARRPALAAGAD